MIRLFACLAALSFVTGPALAQAAKRDQIVILKKAEQDAPRDHAAKMHEILQRIERLQKEILALRAWIHDVPRGTSTLDLDYDHDGDLDLFIVKQTDAAGQFPFGPGAERVFVQRSGIAVLRQAQPNAAGGIDALAKRVLELAAKLEMEERKARSLLDSKQYAKASLAANHAAKLAKMLEGAKKKQALAKKAHKSGSCSPTTTGSVHGSEARFGRLEQRIDRIEKLVKQLLAEKSK